VSTPVVAMLPQVGINIFHSRQCLQCQVLSFILAIVATIKTKQATSRIKIICNPPGLCTVGVRMAWCSASKSCLYIMSWLITL